jgi:hypothetical protein
MDNPPNGSFSASGALIGEFYVPTQGGLFLPQFVVYTNKLRFLKYFRI